MAIFHPEISAANDRFMMAVRTDDEAVFTSLYTNEAILLLPGREPLTGLPGVQTFFASFKARGVLEVNLISLEIEVLGDTAWERGNSELKGLDGEVIGKGKYIVIWKRDAGGWKLHRDIMNASV